MALYSSSGIVQVSGSPEIPNEFHKMLFTRFLHCCREAKSTGNSLWELQSLLKLWITPGRAVWSHFVLSFSCFLSF